MGRDTQARTAGGSETLAVPRTRTGGGADPPDSPSTRRSRPPSRKVAARGRSNRRKGAAAPEPPDRGRAEPVGGELTFDRAIFSEIATRILRDVRDVKQTAGDVTTGFLGRLLSMGSTRPGITVEDGGETVAFHVEVVVRHGVDFYDLGLEIQRRIAERVLQMTGRSCVVNVNVRGVSL